MNNDFARKIFARTVIMGVVAQVLGLVFYGVVLFIAPEEPTPFWRVAAILAPTLPLCVAMSVPLRAVWLTDEDGLYYAEPLLRFVYTAGYGLLLLATVLLSLLAASQ